MDLLRQDREVGADGIDVVGNGSGALLSKGFRQDRHGYPPSVETDAEPIGRRLGQRFTQALMLDALDRLADKGLDQKRTRLNLRNAG